MQTCRRLAAAGLTLSLLAGGLAAQEWTRFRGPNGSGVSPGGATPWSRRSRFSWTRYTAVCSTARIDPSAAVRAAKLGGLVGPASAAVAGARAAG